MWIQANSLFRQAPRLVGVRPWLLVLLLLGCARAGPGPSARPAASSEADQQAADVAQDGRSETPGAAAGLVRDGGADPDAATPARASSPRSLEVVIQGYQVSDDDGGRAAQVTPEHLRAWVETTNQVFADVGIHFRLDPAEGLLPLRSSIVNDAMPDHDVRKLDAALAPVVEAHPGRLVVLFRHGPGKDPSAVGFSGLFEDYVVMPGFESTHHCGHDQKDALAHEIGHFLGLPHTFVKTFASQAAAEQFFRARGRDRLAFDGDGFEDTAPDPAIVPMECTEQPMVELAGVRFEPPRRNLMSYYRQRSRLSASQRVRARWAPKEFKQRNTSSR